MNPTGRQSVSFSLCYTDECSREYNQGVKFIHCRLFVSDVNLKMNTTDLHPTLKNDVLLASVLVIVGNRLTMQSEVVKQDF